MARAPSGEYVTVSIRRVWTAVNATGATSLVLDIVGMEPIAFEVDQPRIDILREKLAEAELLLSQQGGNA